MSPKRKKRMTGARILYNVLMEEGVDVIFGYPGGANLPFYDVLCDSNIRHILVRHEQAAAHMADGYARASGRVGVCLATSGPGATNLVTGIATAYLDSSPIVAITGQVERRFIGTDAFQEVDIVGITIPITKHNQHIMTAGEIVPAVKTAFWLAKAGRPGPVLLDIPRDVLLEEAVYDPDVVVTLEGYNPIISGHSGQIKRAAKLLSGAKNPVIVAGGGVIRSGATDELIRLSQLLGAPVLTTLMGKSAVPPDYPYYLGMIGMHGTSRAMEAVKRADVIVAAGARFGDRAVLSYDAFEKMAKFIQIDIDPAEIEKTVEVDIPIVGDAGKILEELNNRLEKDHANDITAKPPPTGELERYEQTETMGIPAAIELLSKKNLDAVVTTDVGRHQIWAAKYYQSTGLDTGMFITSGGLGTMGFGLPASLGAKVARPDKRVILITGDGSFMMNIQELATSSHYDLPVLVLLMNDHHLGMIRQLQDAFYDAKYMACEFPENVDFVAAARAMGLDGRRVTSIDQLDDAIEEGLRSKHTFVVECLIDSQENIPYRTYED
ncbi:MAG: biosynthetic-type acetolactate synthase large subunit [Deltaproteobacteria bacterium]|nr:biosynthetic-type acetolactate synthase large subunit [Candidatus Zymogenaceae bacterium]